MNIIIVAEGAIDRKGKPITCDTVKQVSAPANQNIGTNHVKELTHNPCFFPVGIKAVRL